jgi:hypothetical protein
MHGGEAALAIASEQVARQHDTAATPHPSQRLEHAVDG